ncbi:hypothetical protein [Sphaerisporangium fuscum]|uniref:hypothetical protein n=1 Tax=Sphaerisporangium fuscum TaxID=2835868 RepID=UPI001BDCA63C|nr:hypothetical protein [Sphaerisporangium fuscum]
MDRTQTVLAVLAVIAFVVYRQFKTRQATGYGLRYFALAMIVAGLASGGLVVKENLLLGVALLAVELVVAVGFGVLRARTVRVWRDEDGVLWSRGTGWTMLGWLASVLARVGIYAVGQALGLPQPPTTMLVFMGVTVGTQAFVVARRARALPATVVGPDRVRA